MAIFENIRRTFSLQEEKIEEVELKAEVPQATVVEHDVLPVLTPEQDKDARLKDWARQKVLEEWKARALRN